MAKLVEILAKELGEWPEVAEVIVQDADSDSTCWSVTSIDAYIGVGDCWELPDDTGGYFDIAISRPSQLATDHATAIVTREMWQAERGRIAVEALPLAAAIFGAPQYDQAYPIQWRDRIREIDADIEAMTAERAELVSKLADEGFALIAVAAEPADDFGSWLVGDIVECTASEFSFISVGTKYEITGFDEGSICFIDDDGDRMDYGGHNFKFHSRPTA